MDQMSKNGYIHTEKTYDHLIRAHVNSKDTVGLLKAFFQLVQANVETTEHGIQTSVLAYFARNPHYIELVELFLALTSTNPKQQYNVLYHSILNELIKSGSDFRNAQKIHQLLREMDSLRIVPLPATFEVLLHSDAIDFETALQLFAKMRKHRITTVYAYAGIIQRNGQQGRLKECMRLWNELLSHNITPSPGAYLAVMQPLAQRGRSREVTKMINDMLSRGVKVSVLAYTVQAQAFLVEGSLARAIAVLDDMATHRVKPDEKLFGILVRAHMDADDLKTSAQLVERAYTSGVEAGKLVAILVGAFGDSETQEAHDELLKKLAEKEVEITQELREAITRRKASVPFPPGSPPFSFRQPRPNQTHNFEKDSNSFPHSPVPTQPLQSPLPHAQPPFSQPPYPIQYPHPYQYPYAHPQPFFVPYDPTQPLVQPYPYQYPPSSPQTFSQPPTTNISPPSSSSLNPMELQNHPPNATESPNQSPNSTESPTEEQPPDPNSSPSVPENTSSTSYPTPPSLSPPPLSSPIYASHPNPYHYYSHPISPNENTNTTYSSNNYPNDYNNPNNSNIPNSNIPNSNVLNSNSAETTDEKKQTTRAIKQRVQRRIERQDKKIQELQNRHELNNFILQKLNQPLPTLPPLSHLTPSPSPPPQQMSPEAYKRELEQMVIAIQQKLEAFKVIENNMTKNNATNINNTNIEAHNKTNSPDAINIEDNPQNNNLNIDTTPESATDSDLSNNIVTDSHAENINTNTNTKTNATNIDTPIRTNTTNANIAPSPTEFPQDSTTVK
eukprot:Phypoly_transcript_02611.p1 GENE.Phypoly_transcript_02611~~Phypoly_transcript_02611.p1  ORF type:complete len:909 (+),score=208.99 Phypoly_transcript_02611:378-2729(+)